MRRLLSALLLVLLLPGLAAAQSIPVKTVPVAEGDQFLLFPSQNQSMGGVSIALDDPLHDPFVNPARGINIEGALFSTTPVYYGFASDNEQVSAGSGRTLPVSALLREGRFFGGAAFAWQELVLPDPRDGGFPLPDRDIDRSQDNLYAFGMGGLQIPGSNISVGLSVLAARLNGIEGVRMLYLRGNQVDQSGSMGLYRAGLYWRQPITGHAAEVIFAHHRLDMEHAMMNWVGNWETGSWQEHSEYDKTIGWALQIGYQHKLAEGWRLGTQVTGDWKWHPKIPNYDVMQIPRDPGRTEAYNVGVGLAREVGAATFGLDLVYEPIWSHTWADALTPVETTTGGTIAPGEMTVENHFRFNNARVRMGMRRAGERLNLALGLSAHHIRYHLDQQDYVAASARAQDEHWTEWTLTGGLGVNFPEFQLRYQGALTLGTGQPQTQRVWGTLENADFAQAAVGRSDFLVAPNGPLTLDETKVLTHQVSVIVPLRK